MFYSSRQLTFACVSASLSLAGSLLTLVTFAYFSWLRAFPRALYWHFTLSDVLASLSIFVVAATTNPVPDGNGANPCVANVFIVLIRNVFYLSEYVYVACICHAVFLSLQTMSAKLKATKPGAGAAMIDPERLMQQRKRQRQFRKLYNILGVAIPGVVGIIVFAGYPTCYYENGTGVNEKNLVSGYYAALDLIAYLFSVLFFALNVIKAKQCMRLLDIPPMCQSVGWRPWSWTCFRNEDDSDDSSTQKLAVYSGAPAQSDEESGPKGTIRENAITAFRVYLGMFLVFGIIRFPRQIVNCIELFGDAGFDVDAAIDPRFRLIEAWFVPIQGFVMSIWFSKKFHYRTLWMKEIARLRRQSRRSASDRDSAPVVETISGMF